MTIRELALNLIEHADTTPEEITLDRASEILGWLDPDSDLPEGFSPTSLEFCSEFMDTWNSIVRETPPENIWTP
jgi:hypothetical protein